MLEIDKTNNTLFLPTGKEGDIYYSANLFNRIKEESLNFPSCINACLRVTGNMPLLVFCETGF